MGTNYFAKLKLEKSIVDALYISPIAKMAIERFNLHIGKSSAGWKFLFQEQEIYDCIEHNGQSYYYIYSLTKIFSIKSIPFFIFILYYSTVNRVPI